MGVLKCVLQLALQLFFRSFIGKVEKDVQNFFTKQTLHKRRPQYFALKIRPKIRDVCDCITTSEYSFSFISIHIKYL